MIECGTLEILVPQLVLHFQWMEYLSENYIVIIPSQCWMYQPLDRAFGCGASEAHVVWSFLAISFQLSLFRKRRQRAEV